MAPQVRETSNPTQATHIYSLSLSRRRPFFSQTTQYSFHGVLGNIIYLYSYRCHTFLLGGQDVLLHHNSGVFLWFVKRTFPPIRIYFAYIGQKLFSSFVKESWRSWSTLCLMVKCQYSLLRKYIYSCADSLKVSLTALIYFQRSHWHGPCGESIWKVNLSLEARDGHEKMMKRTYCHTNIGFLVKV